MNFKKIFEAVEKAGFTKEDIVGKSRKQPLALVRQVAIWLARDGRTYEQLGKDFKRNHSACVHACKSIDSKLSYGDVQLDELMKRMGL